MWRALSAVVREMCVKASVLPEEVITTSHGTPEAVLTLNPGAGALANFYASDHDRSGSM